MFDRVHAPRFQHAGNKCKVMCRLSLAGGQALQAAKHDVHSRLPRGDGGLAADEIAAMVGLSVGEVSDLLGTGGSASSAPNAAIVSRLLAALDGLRSAATPKAPSSPRKGTAPESVANCAAVVVSCLQAELQGAENALDGTLQSLPVLLDEGVRIEGAAQCVRGALQRTKGVFAAATEAERRLAAAASKPNN